MSSDFDTMTVNGIDVRMWQGDRMSGRSQARQFAGRLPRGGKLQDGTIRRIEAPIHRRGTITVWLEGDGHTPFDVPDGYRVESISAFGSSGAAIDLTKE